MSRLVKTSGWGGAPRASVIFVHGLGGHAYDTWRRAPDNDTFWPLWLAKDVQGISVYTLAYEAPPSNWLGTSMPLQDRAVNVLEILLSEPGLRTGPIAFVSHSLGGLIVKQILLDMQQQEKRRLEAEDLLERVTQVVFAATPHTGSRQGTLLDRLRFLRGHHPSRERSSPMIRPCATSMSPIEVLPTNAGTFSSTASFMKPRARPPA